MLTVTSRKHSQGAVFGKNTALLTGVKVVGRKNCAVTSFRPDTTVSVQCHGMSLTIFSKLFDNTWQANDNVLKRL